jgi:hypothetical protein
MSVIKTTTLSTLDGSYSVPSETLARGACRAWVNFDGTGTVAIRASFNVSSITDNGTGDYTVNFTNALPDANYAATANSGTTTASTGRVFNFPEAGLMSTTQIRMRQRTVANTDVDSEQIHVSIFR